MSPQPKPGVMKIAPYVPGKAKVSGFAQPLKLSANENPLGCSEAARDAYLRAAAELHLYPDANTSALRAAVAAKFSLAPERLVFGAGSDELFTMACQAYLGAGDNAVQPQYGFAAWAIAVRGSDGEVKSAAERDYTVDVDAMLAAIDGRTRIVLVANPANPTGTCLPFTEIERLHAGLPENVLLILDGAYAECADAPDYADGLAWARDKDNVLVTRTFSKIYGLASLRIGWGYAPPAMTEALNRVRLPFSVPRAGEAAACAALADEDFVSRSVALVKKGRAEIAEAVRGFGLVPIPSQANFVTVRVPENAGVTAPAIEQGLAERGILVRGLANYCMPDCFRISVGLDAQMAKLFAALEAVLRR